ncbi:MAG: YjbQ family protein [Gammaproteobacteria bacterium]|jgi:secondary thiamine-phosphate synthase enzyme|nr:YjbQ family protein [Gammaproteobacteria bacterium]MBT7814622.1 YjbQ family protein [Gammaproteobacteria bacterium]
MKIINLDLTLNTKPKSLVDITFDVSQHVRSSKILNGLCSLYIKHTSASLIIQENADPAVLKDIESFFSRIAPEDESLYEHNSEGPDDMPAHIRSLLTNTSLSIPIINSKLVLGTWQGIYLYEHRNRGYVRKVIVNIMGE